MMADQLELDAMDRKLLFQLDFDARAPLSRIAKKLHTSIQVVKYRLNRLEQRKIIQGYYVDINASKLGYSIYLIYLKFQNMDESVEKEFISHIINQKSVGVNVSINGMWDFCIGIWAKTISYFEQLCKEILLPYEKYIRSKTIMIETEFHYFKPKQIYKEQNNDEIIMYGNVSPIVIDNIDHKILAILSKNCRTSLIEISNELKLTGNAIKKRMQHLEKNQLILGYRVMINYLKMGYLHYRVFMHIENTTSVNEKKLIGFLKYQAPIISVTRTIGFDELEFRCVVKSVDEFYWLMNTIKSNFPEIVSYDSLIYYKFHQSLNYYPFS